jgi:hypothetical protein
MGEFKHFWDGLENISRRTKINGLRFASLMTEFLFKFFQSILIDNNIVFTGKTTISAGITINTIMSAA